MCIEFVRVVLELFARITLPFLHTAMVPSSDALNSRSFTLKLVMNPPARFLAVLIWKTLEFLHDSTMMIYDDL